MQRCLQAQMPVTFSACCGIACRERRTVEAVMSGDVREIVLDALEQARPGVEVLIEAAAAHAELLLPQGIVRACLYLENEGAGPAPLFSELDWVRSCSCGQRSLRMRMAILRAWTEHRGWNSPMHWAE